MTIRSYVVAVTACLLVIGAAGYLASVPRIALPLSAALLVGGATLRYAGWWRALVALAVVASVARSGPLASLLSASDWYAIQFGSLILAAVSTLSSKPSRAARSAGVLIALWAWTAVCVASTLWSVSPLNTIQQGGLLVALVLFVSVTYHRRWTAETRLRGDLIWIAGVISVPNSISLGAIALHESWAYGYWTRGRGVYDNPNYLCVMAAFAGLTLISQTRPTSDRGLRSLAVVLVLINAGCVVLSASRGASLGLLVGFGVLLMQRSSSRMARRFLVGGIAAATVVILAFPTFANVGSLFSRSNQNSTDITSGRTAIWGQIFAIWDQKPQFGWGYRSSDSLNLGQTGTLQAHNTLLTMLVELGVLGFVAFTAFLVALFVSGRGNRVASIAPIIALIVTFELTESSLIGIAGVTAIPFWLSLMSFGRGRLIAQDDQPDDKTRLRHASATIWA